MKSNCFLCTRKDPVKGRDLPLLWEDDKFYILANIKPVKFGHLLIVPKEHITEIHMLQKKQVVKLNDILKAIKKMFEVEGFVDFAVFNLSANDKRRTLPHSHQHFHPILNDDAGYLPSDKRPFIPVADMQKLKEMFEEFSVIYSDPDGYTTEKVDEMARAWIKGKSK